MSADQLLTSLAGIAQRWNTSAEDLLADAAMYRLDGNTHMVAQCEGLAVMYQAHARTIRELVAEYASEVKA